MMSHIVPCSLMQGRGNITVNLHVKYRDNYIGYIMGYTVVVACYRVSLYAFRGETNVLGACRNSRICDSKLTEFEGQSPRTKFAANCHVFSYHVNLL